MHNTQNTQYAIHKTQHTKHTTQYTIHCTIQQQYNTPLNKRYNNNTIHNAIVWSSFGHHWASFENHLCIIWASFWYHLRFRWWCEVARKLSAADGGRLRQACRGREQHQWKGVSPWTRGDLFVAALWQWPRPGDWQQDWRPFQGNYLGNCASRSHANGRICNRTYFAIGSKTAMWGYNLMPCTVSLRVGVFYTSWTEISHVA